MECELTSHYLSGKPGQMGDEGRSSWGLVGGCLCFLGTPAGAPALIPVLYFQGNDCVRISPDAPLQVRPRGKVCFRDKMGPALSPSQHLVNTLSLCSVCRRPERRERRVRSLGEHGTGDRAGIAGPGPSSSLPHPFFCVLPHFRDPQDSQAQQARR